jgi:chemotaxis signal transduction protein
MSTPTSVRARRFAARHAETFHPTIVFSLRSRWFALPIESVERVMVLESVLPHPFDPRVGLARYQEREIPVIDAGEAIFGPGPAPPEFVGKRYLAIVRREIAEIALALDSPPGIRRFRGSAFVPRTDDPSETIPARGLDTVAIRTDDYPPIFLLDVRRLLPDSPV